MRTAKKSKVSKKMKWILGSVGTLVVVILGLFLWLRQTSQSSSKADTTYATSTVTEGTIASSTLLSGTIKANSEQYVYFDSSKGTSASVTVAVGDTVTVGQQVVQYDRTTAQTAYDTAVRALNKIGRQINYLKTYGNLPTTSTSTDDETGETTTTTVQPSVQANASYNQQLQDLNDAYADAQAEVDKAQNAINQTIITSDVDGKVVEVDNSIDPSAKTSQTLVHIVSEGQLQVQGTVTEYDLTNISVGQEIKIKSKVYPDKEWTGKISYISNYPKDAGTSSDSSNATSGSASYEYKADIEGDLDVLKQGFSVSVEVVNNTPSKLVPVSAVVNDGDKNYVWVYDDKTSKVTKVEVTLGSADAEHQEITGGLETNQIVISNPTSNLKDNAKLDNVTSTDSKSKE